MYRVLVATLLVAGCGGDDAGAPDAGGDAGTAAIDAGASGVDGGTDAGAPDAGPPDAGLDSTLAPCDVLGAFDLAAIDPPDEGSEGYVVPTADELDAAEAMVRAAAEERWDDALSEAAAISYEVCRGEGSQAGLVLLRPLAPTRGWAHVAIRTGPARRVILEAPHPRHDRHTVAESIVLFTSLTARAVVASGTHRCANAAPGCSGSSTVCGDPPGYRESDAAHATESVFHRAHVALAETFAGDLVVSVHGMGGDGISVSDGTTDPVDPDAPVAAVAAALVDAGFAGVTACNEGAGVTVDERLCGTTNVQGRHLNGSPDACTTSAAMSSKRFLHLEQALDVRMRPDLVAAAFATAIPE